MEHVDILIYENDGNDRDGKLLSALSDLCTLTGREFASVKVCRDGGKPYFEGSDICFSVSHSGRVWAVAFGHMPLGLDIEIKRERPFESIAKRFFAKSEYDWLKKGGFADFFSVWTAKESYLKYTGEGICSGGLKEAAVADERGLLPSVDGAYLTHISFDGGYAACLCCERPCEINIHDMRRR